MGFGTILFLIIIAVIIYFIVIYNRFASLSAGIDASWADIEVQLKRRYNLIPALLDTLKAYNQYEAETLENIIKVRQEGMGAKTISQSASSATKISSALGQVFALAEAYPNLKANSNFLKLQEELSSLEDALQSARRYYNAMVRDYNTRLESFPDRVIAKKFHYSACEYFQLSDKERDAAYKMPDIKF